MEVKVIQHYFKFVVLGYDCKLHIFTILKYKVLQNTKNENLNNLNCEKRIKGGYSFIVFFVFSYLNCYNVLTSYHDDAMKVVIGF